MFSGSEIHVDFGSGFPWKPAFHPRRAMRNISKE